MNSFVYEIPTKVYFGENQWDNLVPELKKYGTRVLMTYGGGSIKRTGLYDKLTGLIKAAGLELFELSGIEPNPRISSVREGAKLCKRERIDVLLAVGGGSTIDATKFMAAGAKVEHDPWAFFDERRAEISEALPIITVLTLAATGSEMDAVGVITNPDTHDKLGRGAAAVLPKASFLDPTVTYTVSPFQTASGAADMLSHIMEVYFSMDDDLFMLDRFMEGMMETVVKFAPIAMADPTNYEARANLMWTSSWAINGFADGGKQQGWSCHPIEHELSAFYDITHGLGLAIITPRWLEYCLNDATAGRIARFAREVFHVDASLGDCDAAREGITYLSHFLFDTLGLASTLSEIGIDDAKFPIMAEKAARRTLSGYVALDKADVEEILRRSL